MKVNNKAGEQIINGFISQGILESIGDGISIQDPDFKILYQNQSHKEFIGSHTGEYCYEAYEHKDNICDGCPLAISFKDGNIHRAERTVHDGKFKVEITSSILRDPSGKVTAGIEIVRDITKRKKTEEALQHYRDHLEDMVKTRTFDLAAANKQLTQEMVDRQTAEHILKESEERYRRIADAITDYTYTVRVEDSKPVETTHCAACAAVTGYTLEDFASDPYLWIKMVVEEDHDMVLKQANDVLSGEFPPPLEHRIIRKDGVLRWVESNLLPNHDIRGNLVSYDGIVQDITGRKLAEEKLNEVIQFNTEIINDAGEGIIVYDRDLRYLVWNPFMEKISGVKACDVLSKVATDVFPHLKEKGVDVLLRRALNGETITSPDTPFFVPQTGISGWVSGSYSPHRNGSGEIIGIIGTIRDISERKKAEKTLRFLSLVTEQISDSVVTTDLGYEITYANKSFQNLYGYSAEEILGRSHDILNASPDSEQIQSDIYQAVSSGGIWRGELLNRRKDGSTFHCELLVFPIHDEQGKIFAYAGIQRDIAERKKAEQEKEKLTTELKNKNKELEQVIYTTSHDLRTPLVNIDGFSKELESSVNALLSALQRADVPTDIKEKAVSIVDNDIPEALKYISLSISKMDSLLAGLLKLSRLGRSELTIKELDMNKLISDVSIIFKALLNKTRIKLKISDLPNCMGDERQVSQIFSNLIDNAIKYLDPVRPGIIRIWGRREDGHSIFCVDDNGVGIADEYKEKIFDLFKQLEPSKYKGEGLGLTIVRKAVERQQGGIRLESEPGKGSKFFISLPALVNYSD